MRKTILSTMLICVAMAATAQPPLVYDQENTGSHFAKPVMPAAEQLPVIKELPNALEGVNSFSDWEKRRNIISAQIQHYGIGEKPAVKPEQVKARMVGDTLFVDVTVDGDVVLRHHNPP